MSGIGQHFVFLRLQADEAAGTQLLTRPVGVQVGAGEVLAALDAAGQRHLLIPTEGAWADSDKSSRGVTLGPRVLRTAVGDVTYADLHCRIPALDLVFERLAEDVLARLATDSGSPVATCIRVLDEWRALLRTASQDMPRESVVGLVGELEVLRRLAAHSPAAALDAWHGPHMSVHDFVRRGAELEVKTTSSVDGNFVAISNIDQLDPTLVDALHLVVVHVREDPTAPDLDERIDAIAELGVPFDGLLQKVASAGFVYGTSQQIESRFRVRSVRAWAVGESFPGLRRAEIGDVRMRGVSKIRYELALDTAPKPLSPADLDRFLETWSSL